MKSKINRSSGSALITALFIMSIVAIAATAMAMRLQLDIKRTSMVFTHDKLYLATASVTAWAKHQLTTKDRIMTAKDDSGTVAYFPEKYAHIYPGVTTKGQLIDMQARFNLNNLDTQEFKAFFDTLISRVSKETNATQRSLILDATTAWIHEYLPERGQDEHLKTYLKQTPPYYPAFQPMADASEFRLIHGVNAAIYQVLTPFITALPEPTPININTASLTVLRGLSHGLGASLADEFLEARTDKGIKDMATISPLLKKLDIPNQQITLESQYFLSQATTSIDETELTVFTLLKRENDKKGKIRVIILGERLNTGFP